MPSASMSIGRTPAVCAASTISGRSRSRAIRATSASGCTRPVTFEAWFRTIARVSGRTAASMSAAST